jgi:hypothetical protein
MRTTRILALGMLLLGGAAGCAGGKADAQVATAGGATPTASASAATRDKDAPLKHAQCMREQGMTWFPDPEPGGKMSIRIPKGTDKAKFDAAMAACRKWAPDSGGPDKLDPEAVERMRQMAQCMRDNGVKNFPDPAADGSVRLDGSQIGMGPGDPTFDKAEQACEKYMPEGKNERRTSGAGTAGS